MRHNRRSAAARRDPEVTDARAVRRGAEAPGRTAPVRVARFGRARLLGVSLAAVALTISLGGCNERVAGGHFFLDPDSGEGYIHAKQNKLIVREHYRAYLNGQLGWQFEYNTHDPNGLAGGSLGSLKSLRGHGPAAQVLKGFGGARLLGTVNGGYTSIRPDAIIKLHGTMIVTARRQSVGALCMSFVAQQVRSIGKTSYADQLFKGSWKILGGTGSGARLHADGNAISIQPKPRFTNPTSFIVELYFGAKHASLGSARGMSAKCRAAIKPPPPPKLTKVTATFQGWAMSQGPPSPAATLTPDGATLSGAACHAGGDLYGVFQYSGPSAARWEPNVFGPGGTSQMRQIPVSTGRDVLLLFTAPPNGAYQSKIYVTPTGAAQLTGNTVFAPGVNLSC